MPSAATSKEATGLLVQQYNLLRAEISLHLTHFKSQVQYLQVVSAAAVGFLGFSLTSSLAERRDFWIALMFLMTTVVGYIVFSLLETLYCIMTLSGTTSVLEEKINGLNGGSFFAWESRLTSIFFSAKGLRPGGYFAIYQWIVICAGLFGLPIYYTIYFAPKGFSDYAASWCFVLLNIVYALATLLYIYRVHRYIMDRKKGVWSSARKAALAAFDGEAI